MYQRKSTTCFLETKTEVNMGAKDSLRELEKGLEDAENG